jgi:hypothetical protein
MYIYVCAASCSVLFLLFDEGRCSSLNVSPASNLMTVFVATKKQEKVLNVLFVFAVDTVFGKEERLYIFYYTVVRA